MSGLFRGALNLIQGQSTWTTAHPLVGNYIEVGSMRLRVDSVIAEGGFATVFAAHDNTNRYYALKRQFARDKESMDLLLNEIRILKELSGHPSLVEFVAAAQKRSQPDGYEFLILTELCLGGSVADLMRNTRLTTDQCIKIFHSATLATRHMHERTIPITHRDIKMQRSTTPMYRSPEILDTYQNFAVGPQQDIWALGCVLYYMCYRVHPFQDSAKLRILNVAYSIPSGFDEFEDVVPVIQSCLQLNPVNRPVAGDLVETTSALAVALDVNLKERIIVHGGVVGRPPVFYPCYLFILSSPLHFFKVSVF
ncbi:unnamed protein product [Angiostrongylus costaricensis]|uniref:Protein kinase domain-containing protein n=1 Tax=Angiostrongylus costaricensis TaxID=334426 RepID=A0A0R3PBB5_ANGCS|nr:unnamed protein product [Angiostrongylus costaricensis]